MDPYEFNTRRYHKADYRFADQMRVGRLLSFVQSGWTLLDVGCFDGTIGRMLIDKGNTVHGIESSERALEEARAKGVLAKRGNLEEPFEFESTFFDAVLAGEIIEHVYDIDQFLSEIHRVLKPNGVLLLSTPNLAAFGRRLLLLLNRNPHIEISYTGDAAGHIRYFVRDTLADILTRHGFRIDVLTSDVVNFNGSGSLRLVWLARLVPTLGRCLIVKATKV